MVSERSLAVLHAIISDYVVSNEPVGSKALVERHQFGVSAATIRNDMAHLEDEDLIVAPHTSSGRIPTDKGYRLYVDTLAKIRPITAVQSAAIERFLGESSDLDDVLGRTVRLLSQLTNQVAVVQYPSLKRTLVNHIELVSVAEDRVLCVLILGSGVVEQQTIRLPGASVTEEWAQGVRERIAVAIVGNDLETAVAGVRTLIDTAHEWVSPAEHALVSLVFEAVLAQLQANRSDRMTIAGTANLSRAGEFVGNLPAVLDALEEQVTLLRLFGELAQGEHEVALSIGRENEPYGLSGASVLATSYESDGEAFSNIGVLGPLRMDYPRNISAVRAVARYLNQKIGEVG